MATKSVNVYRKPAPKPAPKRAPAKSAPKKVVPADKRPTQNSSQGGTQPPIPVFFTPPSSTPGTLPTKTPKPSGSPGSRGPTNGPPK